MITNRISYDNGNCKVTILKDGTKIRSYNDEPAPVYPETLDVKITDYCDAGCRYCHESSTVHGRHCDLRAIDIFSGLPAGVELAIGGGNPLSHPAFCEILSHINGLGLIANVTINSAHLDADTIKTLIRYQEVGLLNGIGISVSDHSISEARISGLSNVVLHVIVGVISPLKAITYLNHGYQILILGYKYYGFGGTFMAENKLPHEILHWRYWLKRILVSGSVSFDNLALEQLQVSTVIDNDTWDKHYMGDDGLFSMYLDLVTGRYARSSTSERKKIFGSIKDMFTVVRSLK